MSMFFIPPGVSHKIKLREFLYFYFDLSGRGAAAQVISIKSASSRYRIICSSPRQRISPGAFYCAIYGAARSLSVIQRDACCLSRKRQACSSGSV
ncbi:hypothetical protein DET60_104210 [Raoultella planticola]|nr:hypothetical protein DFO76_102612 [Raoultella planticola]TDX38015.1 hypothetical protein DET60_104210 [Raoultella planticola]